MWSSAATVFVVVALAGLTVMGVWEHNQRSEEHNNITITVRNESASLKTKMEEVICTSRLNLLAQTLPKGQAIMWQDIPRELWPCMPRNFIDEGRTLK
jgi:hypothetical protein